MAFPQSMDEFLRRDDEFERRTEALARRHQHEVFAEVEADAGCPNCGEVGCAPVFWLDADPAVGYYAEEQGCTACCREAQA